MTFAKLRKVIAIVTVFVMALGLMAVWVPAGEVLAEGRTDDGARTGLRPPNQPPVTDVRADGMVGCTQMTIATGWDHSLAILADGSLWAWGSNDVGQLGDGTTADRQIQCVLWMGLFLYLPAYGTVWQ